MECGGLSVIEGAGTPGMLLWCAGSSATNMKVSTHTTVIESLSSRLTFIKQVFLVQG